MKVFLKHLPKIFLTTVGAILTPVALLLHNGLMPALGSPYPIDAELQDAGLKKKK